MREGRRHPTGRVRWLSVPLIVALVAGACGEAGPPDEPAAPEAPEPQVQTAEAEVEVFFTNDHDPFRGDLCLDVFPVTRTVPADDPVTGALTALLAGPTAAERAQGYRSGFAEYAEGALVAIEVTDGTALVTLTDLRGVATHGNWCTAAELLTSLDRTLLAFDHIEATRYAFDGAEAGAFYGWLHLAAPDATRPGPATPPSGATIDLDAGWSPIEPSLPIELGCCGLATTGPVSPDGPLPQDGWPTDGFYDVDVYRPHDDPTTLELTIRRWVACGDLTDDRCSPDPEPEPGQPDRRITPALSDVAVRRVRIADLEVILFPIAEPEIPGATPLRGEAPAFATLLLAGLDPAFRQWIEEPALAGLTAAQVDHDLRHRRADATCPFETASRYRGPLDSRLVLFPSWEVLHLWPHAWNGLYGWHATLEIRDGVPLLYVFAGQIAG